MRRPPTLEETDLVFDALAPSPSSAILPDAFAGSRGCLGSTSAPPLPDGALSSHAASAMHAESRRTPRESLMYVARAPSVPARLRVNLRDDGGPSPIRGGACAERINPR